MAKKQLTPDQTANKAEAKAIREKKILKTIEVLFGLAAVIACVFCLSATFKNNTESAKTEIIYTDNNVVADTDIPQNTENNNNNNIVSDAAEETEKTDEAENQDAAFKTQEEMVEYFNTCANKVKTDATEVVKNFEKRKVGELKVPDLLQSIAETLLKENMKDDTDPIVYSTKEEIRENFLVPSQDYVSCMKVEDLETISYKDNGNEYEFYIRLKDEKDPRAGSGVGSVCDVIETHEVAEKAPSMLQEFSTSYYDCEVTATIDKETGRVTHIVYSTPLTLNVVVSLLGTHTASVGFTFIKDYTITY